MLGLRQGLVRPMGHRPNRVGEEIRHELGELLSRGAIHDPGIGFITLTRVAVTADLQLARIHYTTPGDEKSRRQTARALDRAPPSMRRQIGGRLRVGRGTQIVSPVDPPLEMRGWDE